MASDLPIKGSVTVPDVASNDNKGMTEEQIAKKIHDILRDPKVADPVNDPTYKKLVDQLKAVRAKAFKDKHPSNVNKIPTDTTIASNASKSEFDDMSIEEVKAMKKSGKLKPGDTERIDAQIEKMRRDPRYHVKKTTARYNSGFKNPLEGKTIEQGVSEYVSKQSE